MWGKKKKKDLPEDYLSHYAEQGSRQDTNAVLRKTWMSCNNHRNHKQQQLNEGPQEQYANDERDREGGINPGQQV